jgi:hypothetical protein
MGKSTINGLCSIATLNYQRVSNFFICIPLWSEMEGGAAIRFM